MEADLISLIKVVCEITTYHCMAELCILSPDVAAFMRDACDGHTMYSSDL